MFMAYGVTPDGERHYLPTMRFTSPSEVATGVSMDLRGTDVSGFERIELAWQPDPLGRGGWTSGSGVRSDDPEPDPVATGQPRDKLIIRHIRDGWRTATTKTRLSAGIRTDVGREIAALISAAGAAHIIMAGHGIAFRPTDPALWTWDEAERAIIDAFNAATGIAHDVVREAEGGAPWPTFDPTGCPEGHPWAEIVTEDGRITRAICPAHWEWNGREMIRISRGVPQL